MIAIDTNVLVYAHRADSTHHHRAASAIQSLAEGDRPWAIPWQCLYEFWAVVTHPRIYDPPSTPWQAMEQINAWRSSPSCRCLGELSTTAPAFDRLEAAQIRGPRVHDGHIALICLAHGVNEILTNDRDFSLFPWLSIRSLMAVDAP